MREMAMKTRILHYYSDTEDQQGTLKLTLDEMYLEVQVVEKNLRRNPRTLFPHTGFSTFIFKKRFFLNFYFQFH